MIKGIRKNLTIPGLLAPKVPVRFGEFGYACFSPYGVELVCYDLRVQARHTVTLELAKETQPVQDAIDSLIISQYKPGKLRSGLMIDLAERLKDIQKTSEHSPAGAAQAGLSAKMERITFPAAIWPLVERRWKALGYASLSAYVTALIRYDLMIGGPHLFTGEDCRTDVQEALNQETLRVHKKGRSRKILLDYLIERASGTELLPEELEQIKISIAKRYKQIARVTK